MQQEHQKCNASWTVLGELAVGALVVAALLWIMASRSERPHHGWRCVAPSSARCG